MIEQPPIEPRPLLDVERRDRLARLHQPQEMIRTVQRTRFARRRDDGDGAAADGGGANDVALIAGARERVFPAKAGNRR